MDGSRKVNDKDFSIRMEACLSCDHIIKKDPKTCGLCGCVLKVKARWRTSDCPDNRWKALVTEEQEDLINEQIKNG